ncbi:hypothetical protein QZH41_015944 [Actinostola sp. cb2023]|nr:hypothetical protein QZH41_015944 [Actinostola sp. cb2023]
MTFLPPAIYEQHLKKDLWSDAQLLFVMLMKPKRFECEENTAVLVLYMTLDMKLAGLECGRRFKLDQEKIIPWDEICVAQQSATELMVERRKLCLYSKEDYRWLLASTEKESSEISSPTLNQGWALHKAKGGASRFSNKVRQYLTAKFEIGATSGRKEDPNKVAQDMRNAKTESGDRLFSRDEWLTKSQIQGFFSRLSSSRKRKLVPAPTSTEQQDNPEEDDVDQDELNHMTTIDNVITEIGLSHPIVYDIYDLCDYARNKKMKAFTVSMLKEICTFFDIPFMSKDTKAVLIFKLKQMTSQCSCSAEDR